MSQQFPARTITPPLSQLKRCAWRLPQALILLSLLLGTTTTTAAPTTLTLQLRWQHQFQFAGYYAAVEQGFFAEEGLQVKIKPGGPDINPIAEVLSGRAQLGVAAGDLVHQRLHGKPLVALAALFQHSASVLIARRDSGIDNPHALDGKRVATIDGGQPIIEIIAMLANEGVALDHIQQRSNHGGIDDLMDGRVDAEYGYLTNEPWLAQQAGLDIQLLRPLDYGVDFYGDTLFTSEAALAAQPETIAAFRRAALRGWDYAMRHPEAMITLIRERYATNKSEQQLRFEASNMAKLMYPDLIEIGHMNPGRWQTMADTFIRLGMAPEDATLGDFVYQSTEQNIPVWLKRALYAAIGIAVIAALATLLLSAFNRRLSSAVTRRTEELRAEVQRRQQAEQAVIRQNEALEETVSERTAELRQQKEQTEASNRDLSSTLSELRLAQQELIQSEKMAALGQLVAGVAHEINTPLGAIQLSVGGIQRFLGKDLPVLPELLAELPQELRNALFELLGSDQQSQPLSSRERRQHRRRLAAELETLRPDDGDADDIADTLVDMGVYQVTPALTTLLQSDQHQSLLGCAAGLSQLHSNTATIDTATQRAAKVVFALKTYAHRDAVSEKRLADVNAGLDTVLTLYHNQMKHGIELKRQFTDSAEIACFPDELNQVWTNLIHNALQAMENRGTLDISTRSDDEHLIVTICDSGPGIPAAMQEKIFEPFYTTKGSGEGSGLGLDIVRRVIDQHQGSISVSAASPHGACFKVSLPRQ